MLLFALACATPEPAFSLQLRKQRSFSDLALATGARTPVVLHPERRREHSQDPVRFDEVSFTVSDPDVLAIEGTTLVARAEGDAVLTATATIDGYRSTNEATIRVRPVAERVWTIAGAPEPEPVSSVVVLQDAEVTFDVQHRDASGQRLVPDGLEVLSAPHPYAEVEPGTPETTLLRFSSGQPGTFELERVDGEPLKVRVVDGWQQVKVLGRNVRLETTDGALPYFRAPGPKLLSLTRGCEVPPRATGTNPFRIDLSIDRTNAPDDLAACRVQLRVVGRPITVELPVAAAR